MKKKLMILAMPIVSSLSMSLMQELQDMDDRKIGHCSLCHRWTWDEKEVGVSCGMTQPSGLECEGLFIADTTIS